jgi:transcriptional regulator with XRE-family HTH domain
MNRDQARRVGKYIRKLRRARNLSASELAPHVGVDPSQILRLERGEVASPRAALLTRIADYFQMPTTDIFALAGYPTAYNLPAIESYRHSKYPALGEVAVHEISVLTTRLNGLALADPDESSDECADHEPSPATPAPKGSNR